MPRTDNRSDRELIDLCNSGDREAAARAFETLYSRHKDYVQRVAFRYVRDADQALDVLQETFSDVLRKFPPTGQGIELTAKFSTLLYAMARNAAISLRRRTAAREAAVDLDPDELPAAGDPPAGYDGSFDLGGLLRGLSPQQREMVTLRFVDDHSLRDIAAILELPLGTVKSRLHSAVSALRKSPSAKEFFEK